MSTHERFPDSTTVATGAQHEQMLPQSEFTRRGDHDILANLHQTTDPEQVTPKPEAMSESADVSAIAFTSHPNAATGTYAFGYNDKFGVVTPYETGTVVMPTKLESMLQTRSFQYGRTAVTKDLDISGTPYGKTDTNSGEAFLFKGSFHGSLDNDDPAERRTIVSFAASNSRLSDNRSGTSCTFVVKGDHEFGEVLDIARKKFPGIMGPLEEPHREDESQYSGPVGIHLANAEPIELGEHFNEPSRYRNRREQNLSTESSVRMKVNLLSSELQGAFNIARQHNPNLSDEELANRVIQASRWRIQYAANNAQLTPDSVDKLGSELKGLIALPADREVQDKWRTDHGISYNQVTEARNDEQRKDTSWKIDLKRKEAPDTREGRWYKGLGKSIGGILGMGSKPRSPKMPKAPKAPKRREVDDIDATLEALLGSTPAAEAEAPDAYYDEPEQTTPVVQRDADDVSAVKVHTHKDRQESKLKSLHAAFMNRATELQIGSTEEKYNRRLRRGLGAVAVAAAGVAGAYLATRGIHFSFGGGNHLVDGTALPTTGGAGGQLPTDIPQTPSTHFGTEIMPSGSGTSTVPTPDQVPGKPSTGNVPSSPMGVPTPDQVPGTPQVPDVPKPGTGTFDPNAIGISTPAETLPAGNFHLNPGQTLSEYIRAQMPHASTNAVYNEVARIMEANHLPVDWSAPDPFEAARHIRPTTQLHT